jgi:alginate O-acetyltransferase complex protein AlgJ
VNPRATVAERSGMLMGYRRWFAAVSCLLLVTPLLWGLVLPDSPEWILREGRRPAPAPEPPQTVKAIFALPGQVDSYLNDHFGLRQKMMRLNKDLTKPIWFNANNVAVIGKSGRMFGLTDDMVGQSAGHVVRPEKVAEAANMIAAIHDALARQGVRFLVALPPNSSTIYQDDLPRWARNPGRKTEYDLLLENLRARGIKMVDLRPPLKEARAAGPTYLLNDLHWNVRGAIAGFNAVVEADGHPDWRIDPSSAIGPLALHKGGDIATMAGVQDTVTEMMETLNLQAAGRDEQLSHGIEGRVEAARDMADHVIVSDRPGPTIMVIGDSFTSGYFPLFLSPHVRQAAWFHHEYCSFDWAWIGKMRPDEVWWMPVERLLVCRPGQRPKNFPENETGFAHTSTDR